MQLKTLRSLGRRRRRADHHVAGRNGGQSRGQRPSRLEIGTRNAAPFPTRIDRPQAVAHLCHDERDTGGSSRMQAARWATQPPRTVAKPRYPR